MKTIHKKKDTLRVKISKAIADYITDAWFRLLFHGHGRFDTGLKH